MEKCGIIYQLAG